MKYNVGMYGGSFDPLHIGHIHDIIRAASVCRELFVMISWCEGRESTSIELRYRWILNSTKHLNNIKIIMIEDTATSKEEYNTNFYWEKGAHDIKSAIGKKIDVVFCGSDYYGTNRFESLYSPESEVVYFDRAEVPISSTNIRDWAVNHWDYIPDVCKPYYAKKVLVVGSESVGKTTLVRNLALAYNTNFVAEVGRETCDYAGGEDLMIDADLHENFLRQKLHIMDSLKATNRVLFVDTDAITTLFYSYLLLSDKGELLRCEKLAQAINDITEWDLILFLEPTVEFVQDGTRNEVIANERHKYSEQLKTLLKEYYAAPIFYLDGDYLQRFNDAKLIIERTLKIDTRW